MLLFILCVFNNWKEKKRNTIKLEPTNLNVLFLYQSNGKLVYLFCYRHQHELKLLRRRHQTGALITQMLQCRRDIDLPGALVHPGQHQVQQNIRSRTSSSIAAMYNHRARSTAIRLVHLAPELEQRLGRRRESELGPRQEMELSDGSRFGCAQILQVERANQIVFAPDVFAD